MDAGGGGHGSGNGASGSHSSGLSPNVAAMSVMPSINQLPAFGFGAGAPAAHGGPVYPAQSLSTTGCSPLYLPPPAAVVGPVPYPAAVSSPPHSLVSAHCGSPYPAALQSPGGHSSAPYATGSLAVANGTSTKLLVGRHMCAICEDAASGKHYGVYSCEGCKGFFKRTVRKDLKYTCRENNNCIVDKRQRNRCQACRYQRCLQTGMKREAVQEERLGAEKGEMEAESTTAGGEMLIDSILSAEMRIDSNSDSGQTIEDIDTMPAYSWNSICSQVSHTLVDWALAIPHFTELSHDDQLMILKAGWNELLISSFAHRSVALNNCLALSVSLRLSQGGSAAEHFGLSPIYDRILTDLVLKMRAMCVDRFELGCLRVIVLFNPDAKGLQMTAHVESLREKVYVTLEEYCRRQYPDDPGRFAKLLLRLPALRTIGLKCASYLFLSQLCQAEGSSPETYISLLMKGIYTS